MFELDGKVAIVTGAGSKRGLGQAIAKSLAENGASIVVAALDLEGAEERAVEIRNSGTNAIAAEVNVTSEESVKEMVEKAINEFGKVDILVNNAGITQPVKVMDTTIEDWERIMNVNLTGTFLATKAVLPSMLKQEFGRIINISSVSAKRGGGVFGGAHYSAAKAGMLGFAKALAREVSPSGITVNSLAPGLCATDIRGGLEEEEERQKMTQDIPCRRMGTPEEIGAAVCYLASEEAGYITGEDIDINGGSHMD